MCRRRNLFEAMLLHGSKDWYLYLVGNKPAVAAAIANVEHF